MAVPDILDGYGEQQQPTLEQRKMQAADAIGNGVKSLLYSNVDQFRRLWTMIWANPLGLTPQQVFDSLGTKAVSLLQRAAAHKAYLEGQWPDVVLPGTPDGFTLVPSEDGTVTVAEQ